VLRSSELVVFSCIDTSIQCPQHFTVCFCFFVHS